MATQAHCAYCFESLASSFERRRALSLSQVEHLWSQYHTPRPAADAGGDAADAEGCGGSGPPSTGTPSPQSGVPRRGPADEHPLFVTWTTVGSGGRKSLRGCIGTFEPQPLEDGLRRYALTSAFDDARFPPITATVLPALAAHVTLLTNFSAPGSDPLRWDLGTHGLRIAFDHRGRRHGATYLPDVAREQGWTKEETLLSLMRKAGWTGGASQWQSAWRDGQGELVTYEGTPAALGYAAWKEWRDWVARQGVEGEASN